MATKTITDYIQESADKYIMATFGTGARCRKAYIEGVKRGMILSLMYPAEISKLQIL